MKTPLHLSLIFLALFAFCKKDPTGPEDSGSIVLDPYAESIDSYYFKMWSDSSWTKFGQITSLNGITYMTIVTSSGAEYYYSSLGYAGFQTSGQPLIMFDKPLSGLPDTVTFGQTYSRQTTFSVQGTSFTLTYEQTLIDTSSVSAPFGMFSPCVHFSVKGTVSSGGQTEAESVQLWLAQGPGEIKDILNSGTTIVMVRGKVNGRGWGMPYPLVAHGNEKGGTPSNRLSGFLSLTLGIQSFRPETFTIRAHVIHQ